MLGAYREVSRNGAAHATPKLQVNVLDRGWHSAVQLGIRS
jgi:hypothetical protein